VRRVLLAAFFLLFLTACGGGGGSTPSLPRSVSATSGPTAAPSSNTVTVQVPADAKGSLVAGISDALLVGGIGTNIADAAITVSTNASAGTTATSNSAVVAVPRLRASQSAPLGMTTWQDGPGSTTLLRPVLSNLRETGWRAGQERARQSLPSTVGAQANLWVQYFQAGVNGTSFSQVPATLAVQTAHANIWVENSLASLIGNQSALNTIGANVETAIASDNAHFGSSSWDSSAAGLHQQYATCDSNGNQNGGSSSMWIVPSDPHVNFLYVAPAQIGVGGYMDADSVMPEAVIRCTQAANGTYHSNEAPFIVLAYYGDTHGMDYVLREDSIVHPAHEYQHLINLVHHAILQTQSKFEDGLLNEGLSMMAQDFAISSATGGAQPLDGENVSRTAGYLAATQNYSVAGFAGVQTSGQTPLYNCATCYSPAWLFERYLYDRFGGDAYTHAMDAGTNVSWPELQSVTGTTPQSLLHDFAIAIAASGTSSAAGNDTFTSLNLRSTYVDQFGNSTALNGPAPLGTLSSSGTQTFNVLVGAYAYFSVPATTPATSASLTDGTNGSFDLNATVVGL
jgi:hypothetical protein